MKERLQSSKDLLGRMFNGVVCAIMIRQPEKRPAAPIPAMARPTMKTVEDGETAHIKLPISKRARKIRKVHLKERCTKTLPERGEKTHLASVSSRAL